MREEAEARAPVGRPSSSAGSVVGRAAAETRREDLLQDADDVDVEERHAAGGELLAAPDRVEVSSPAEPGHRAPAVALGHHRLVAHRHVQEHERGAATERGKQQRIRGRPDGPASAPGWMSPWRSARRWTSSGLSGDKQPCPMELHSMIA